MTPDECFRRRGGVRGTATRLAARRKKRDLGGMRARTRGAMPRDHRALAIWGRERGWRRGGGGRRTRREACAKRDAHRALIVFTNIREARRVRSIGDRRSDPSSIELPARSVPGSTPQRPDLWPLWAGMQCRCRHIRSTRVRDRGCAYGVRKAAVCCGDARRVEGQECG